MLTFFTDPYPDELLYSACARYHYYIGNIDYKDTLEELFGKRSIIPNFYMGCYLDYLSNQLGCKYSAEDLIWKHTIFPYYAPFLPANRKKELIDEMKYETGGALYTKLGMVAGSICEKDGIYYCYECAKKDRERYGETYIHREHQLQGILVCPHHRTYLQKYKIDQKDKSRLEFIRLDEKYLNKDNTTSFLRNINPILHKIAALAYKLLQSDTNAIDKNKVLKAYKNLLAKRGLTSTNGGVKQQDLYTEFIGFYHKEILVLLESIIDNDDEYNWLRVVTRDLKRTVHPVRHLLLMNFLVGDTEKFFGEIKEQYNPFGKGPWPCLNKVADHYRQEVILNIEITPDYKTRLPVGTFKCSCGFVYSRKGPDRTDENRYKIGRIKAFGYEWDGKLKENLKAATWSLRGIAKKMHCDPMTILKKDAELGIYAFHPEDKEIIQNKKCKNTEDDKKLGNYKETIIETIKDNHLLTRTQIRTLVEKEYTYLYRKDKKWLLEQLPNKIRTTGTTESVDWKKRDAKIMSLVQEKHKELLSREKIVRITKSLVGKELGLSALLEKKYERLPCTMQYIEQISETIEEFQLRRCKIIIDHLKQEKKPIKLWQVQRQAGIRTNALNNIKAELEKYINE